LYGVSAANAIELQVKPGQMIDDFHSKEEALSGHGSGNAVNPPKIERIISSMP
jgi:hypothetical protein